MIIQLTEKEIIKCLQEKYADFGDFKIELAVATVKGKKTIKAKLTPYDEILADVKNADPEEPESASAVEEEEDLSAKLNF